MSLGADSRDRFLVRSVVRWFKGAARDLPWRQTPRDPYLSLVSEVMLQQTQVSRVLEKWGPFVTRFPDVRALAEADESQVMALWSGMGYYRRARSLQAAAREVVARFGAEIPPSIEDLRTLPGVGRYTAGAISSIAFGRPEPIVDGNVARVLMRIDGKPFRTGSVEGMSWAWTRAGELVEAARGARVPIALVNEGLMELGAVVCTPRGPACGDCPLRGECAARSKGRQDRIPLPKQRPRKSVLYAEVVLARTRRGTLVERRPEGRMWAGLWQAPTWERSDREARGAEVARWIGVERVRRAGGFVHETTHRTVQFRIWTPCRTPPPRRGRVYLGLGEIAELALSNPQRRILLGSCG